MTRRFFLILCGLFAGSLFAASVAHADSAQGSTVIYLTVLNPVSTTTYYVSVVKSGSGTGTVTSSDGGIVCGSICFETNIPNASTTVLTATADPDSTFTGWNVSGDPTACPGIGTCSATTSEVITATFDLNSIPTPPATSPPTQPILTSPSGPSQFLFEDFSSETGTTSAVVDWYTTLPSVSTVSWGINADGASGTGSETGYSIGHSIELDNLAPDTAYVLEIKAVSEHGAVIYDTYDFRTLPVTNSIPLNVTNFIGQVSFGGNILLTWNNPFEPDFSQVIITRGDRFYPRDPGEGYLVYQGPEEAVLDTSVVPGQEYYYTAFAVNTEGNHSSGTLLNYGLPALSGAAATSTPIFGTGNPGGNNPGGNQTGTTAGNSSNPPASSILSVVDFFQNNKLLPEIDSEVSIVASEPVLVEVPSSAVPNGTEEVTITVGEGSPAEATFIFQKLDDGTLQALVPAILPTGPTPFTIRFLGLGSETDAVGTFNASGTPAPFIPQSLSGYLYQTYITNNFLCTTLPVFLMFVEVMAGIVIIFLLVLI